MTERKENVQEDIQVKQESCDFETKLYRTLNPVITKGIFESLSGKEFGSFLKKLESWDLTEEDKKILCRLSKVNFSLLKYSGLFKALPIKGVHLIEKATDGLMIRDLKLELVDGKLRGKIKFWHDGGYYPIWEIEKGLETIPFKIRTANEGGVLCFADIVWNKERPIYLMYTFGALGEIIWFKDRYIKVGKYIEKEYGLSVRNFIGKYIDGLVINGGEEVYLFMYLFYFDNNNIILIKLGTDGEKQKNEFKLEGIKSVDDILKVDLGIDPYSSDVMEVKFLLRGNKEVIFCREGNNFKCSSFN